MHAITLPCFTSSSVVRHPFSNLNPVLRSSSSRAIFQIIKCSSAEVAQADGTEDLSGRERRRLRNERRQRAIESRPSWREVVEDRLSKKARKPSVIGEMSLKKLVELGLRWWKIEVRKNSERLATQELQEAFAKEYPDAEFEVFLPATPSTKKLKNGDYSKKITVLIPGYIFIRCCLNQEIHDFILSSPRIRRFSGKKVNNRNRWIIKPIPVSDLDMELNFLQYKQGPEKYDSEIKDESLKEERNETNDDVVVQDLFHDFDVGDFNTDKNAHLHANSISNNDVSGKEAGSFGITSDSERSSKGFSSSIHTDDVNDLSLKGLKKQGTTKEEREKPKDYSVRQAFVEDVEVEISIDKNTNSHAYFADESSNIDINGEQVGFSGAKFNSNNLSNMLADSTSLNHAAEPSLRDLDEQHQNNRHDSELVAGSTVRITSGPFAEFTGYLEEFDLKTREAKVMLVMFGQETAVDVKINQIGHES